MGAGSSETVETDEIESSKVVLGFGRTVIIFSEDFSTFCGWKNCDFWVVVEF